MGKIKISPAGIKKSLKNYNYLQAIGEYVWNGFDAGARVVELAFTQNELHGINKIEIQDDGYGIPNEKLNNKFGPFLESEKFLDPSKIRHTSAIHGKNGYGRLTFFKFALKAVWDTVYTMDGKLYQYKVAIDSNELDIYTDSDPISTTQDVGTKVTFNAIIESIDVTEIENYLGKEFGWFLELNKAKEFTIKIDGQDLDYSKLINDMDKIELIHPKTGRSFEVRYIQWQDYQVRVKDSEGITCESSINTLDVKAIVKDFDKIKRDGNKFYLKDNEVTNLPQNGQNNSPSSTAGSVDTLTLGQYDSMSSALDITSSNIVSKGNGLAKYSYTYGNITGTGGNYNYNPDRDWYKINVDKPGAITIYLTPNMNAAYNLYLLDAAGNNLAYSTNPSRGSTQYISFNASSQGIYYIKVVPYVYCSVSYYYDEYYDSNTGTWYSYSYVDYWYYTDSGSYSLSVYNVSA